MAPPLRPPSADAFEAWVEALEKRHLTEITFAEARRALRALSGLYVHERSRLDAGAALEGRGKRAVFALFYGPLHFLLTRHVVRALRLSVPKRREIWDLGCGTGAAGAAWALEQRAGATLVGVDRHPWAVAEARWTYRTLGLRARARREELGRLRLPARAQVLAAFAVNELSSHERERLWDTLRSAFHRGGQILILEPIALRSLRWWNVWAERFEQYGGRADTWRVSSDVPELVRRLDRAAGLDHRELTCRSLWLPQPPG